MWEVPPWQLLLARPCWPVLLAAPPRRCLGTVCSQCAQRADSVPVWTRLYSWGLLGPPLFSASVGAPTASLPQCIIALLTAIQAPVYIGAPDCWQLPYEADRNSYAQPRSSKMESTSEEFLPISSYLPICLYLPIYIYVSTGLSTSPSIHLSLMFTYLLIVAPATSPLDFSCRSASPRMRAAQRRFASSLPRRGWVEDLMGTGGASKRLPRLWSYKSLYSHGAM